MAEPCTIIILPQLHELDRVRELQRAGVDVANQALLPPADRRNVTEIWRVRLDREYAELLLKNAGKPDQGG